MALLHQIQPSWNAPSGLGRVVVPLLRRAAVLMGVKQSPQTCDRSGAEGDRTPDLRAASAALSRLSYGPKRPAKYSKQGFGVNALRAPGIPPSALGGHRARGTPDDSSRAPRQ